MKVNQFKKKNQKSPPYFTVRQPPLPIRGPNTLYHSVLSQSRKAHRARELLGCLDQLVETHHFGATLTFEDNGLSMCPV